MQYQVVLEFEFQRATYKFTSDLSKDEIFKEIDKGEERLQLVGEGYAWADADTIAGYTYHMDITEGGQEIKAKWLVLIEDAFQDVSATEEDIVPDFRSPAYGRPPQQLPLSYDLATYATWKSPSLS